MDGRVGAAHDARERRRRRCPSRPGRPASGRAAAGRPRRRVERAGAAGVAVREGGGVTAPGRGSGIWHHPDSTRARRSGRCASDRPRPAARTAQRPRSSASWSSVTAAAGSASRGCPGDAGRGGRVTPAASSGSPTRAASRSASGHQSWVSVTSRRRLADEAVARHEARQAGVEDGLDLVAEAVVRGAHAVGADARRRASGARRGRRCATRRARAARRRSGPRRRRRAGSRRSCP